jgi:flagellar biosynthesis protein FlhG
MDSPFTAPGPAFSAKALDREMIPLLKSLSYLPSDSPMMRMAALLLYRYAVLKLFTNETAVRLISAFLPHRTEAGIRIRDRRRQIARLTGRDAAYQARYFALVKKLYPVISRQLDHLVSTFGLQSLLFRSAEGTVARNAYAKLFSATLYEMVNSGLGIVAGFRFRPSSRAFADGYRTVMKELQIDD